MFDPNQDPTKRTNVAAFWVGYGRAREGAHYTDVPSDPPDYMAGYLYAMIEEKLRKPWWKSRTLWLGIGSGLLSGLAMYNPDLIQDNPRLAAGVAVAVSVAVGFLRMVTKTSLT